VEFAQPALDFLGAHDVMAVGTSSFTGLPHVSMTIYANDAEFVYFPASGDEITRQNIVDNKRASFSVSAFSPDLRKVHGLWGQCECQAVASPPDESLLALFLRKMPGLAAEALTGLQRLAPIELHLVEYEYPADLGQPVPSSVVYQASSPEHAAAIGTPLVRLSPSPNTGPSRGAV
jgi:hypothetical protein